MACRRPLKPALGVLASALGSRERSHPSPGAQSKTHPHSPFSQFGLAGLITGYFLQNNPRRNLGSPPSPALPQSS